MVFPKYFERYGRVEPTQQRGSPWTFSRGQPDKTIWEIMQEDPDEVEGFAKSMRVSSGFYPVPGPYDFSWIADHPIEDKSRPLLVDVGGSDGEVLLSILRNTPGLSAERCVLQDLPHVLDDVAMTRQEEEIKALKKVPIDFFREGPVKGELSRILTDVKPRLTHSLQEPLSTISAAPCTITPTPTRSTYCGSSPRPWRLIAGC